VAVYNYRGYYDNLKKQLVTMNQAGFLEDQYLREICFSSNLDEILRFMEGYQAPAHRTYDK
jgi:hypothetical protein